MIRDTQRNPVSKNKTKNHHPNKRHKQNPKTKTTPLNKQNPTWLNKTEWWECIYAKKESHVTLKWKVKSFYLKNKTMYIQYMVAHACLYRIPITPEAKTKGLPQVQGQPVVKSCLKKKTYTPRPQHTWDSVLSAVSGIYYPVVLHELWGSAPDTPPQVLHSLSKNLEPVQNYPKTLNKQHPTFYSH